VTRTGRARGGFEGARAGSSRKAHGTGRRYQHEALAGRFGHRLMRPGDPPRLSASSRTGHVGLTLLGVTPDAIRGMDQEVNKAS
jgi:hypothetical protein